MIKSMSSVIWASTIEAYQQSYLGGSENTPGSLGEVGNSEISDTYSSGPEKFISIIGPQDIRDLWGEKYISAVGTDTNYLSPIGSIDVSEIGGKSGFYF